MPWKASGVPMLRMQFAQLVRSSGVPVARACRQFQISRDTGYRWLARFDQDPAAALVDRSRRPRSCPHQTGADIEREVLLARDQFGWGARKIHALLARQGIEVPSVRTVHAILARCGQVRDDPRPPRAPLRFERPRPNELWQMDHKCDIEIARAKHNQLSILDDHSRYLLRLAPVADRAITTAFAVLWELMGEVGMPRSILSDNAFSTAFAVPATLSWFDANLICLGIRPVHGRPYHPQTQGKVERFHGTLEREFLPTASRSSMSAYRRDVASWQRLYNTVRPHQAIGDVPPADRWCASDRRRPSKIPEPQYPPGSVLRKVCSAGAVTWKCRRIMAGCGLTGRAVRVQETESTIDLYFAHVRIRSVPFEEARGRDIL
jgi:transposase InsO family protein